MKTEKPDAICKVIKAQRTRSAAATLRYIWREDKCRAKFGVFDLGGISGDIAVDADVLSSGHDGRGEVVKHVVLSMRCAWSKAAEKGLFQMCHEWISKFAPDRDWIAGVHVKKDNIHCHLAIRNKGSNGRCLKFKKADLYEMVQMAWTDVATPSKGTVAPKTVELAAAFLESGLRGKETFQAVSTWAEKRVEAGAVEVGRRDKSGRLTSIVVDGHRHRVKSLARAVAELAIRRRIEEQEISPIEAEPVTREIASGRATLPAFDEAAKAKDSDSIDMGNETARLARGLSRWRRTKKRIKKKRKSLQ